MFKIQVIMATYNGMPYVKDQINSILNSVLPCGCELSVIISDDGSEQGDMLCDYIKSLNDARVRLISKTRRGGVKANFSFLIKNASEDSDLIFFSDQDDVWLHDKIFTFVTEYNKLSDSEMHRPVLIFSDLKVVDQDLNVISESMFSYQHLDHKNTLLPGLITQNSVTGCACAINASTLKHLKSSRISQSIMHDWYAALVAAGLGRVVFIDKATVLYRQHEKNQIGAKKIDLKAMFCFLSLSLIKPLISEASSSVFRTKQQAILFYEDFYKYLDEEHRSSLEMYINSFKKSILFRLRLFLFAGFKKNGLLRNIAYLYFYVIRGGLLNDEYHC